MNTPSTLSVLVTAQLLAPAASLAAVGIPALAGRAPSERTASRLVMAGFVVAFAASIATLAWLALDGFGSHEVHLGTIFTIGAHQSTFDLVADLLSVPFTCFSSGLLCLVALFAGKYMHRESGFVRFFVLLATFGTGMNLLVLAGSIDVMFAGWELVGVSSTLLIGFFHERTNAVDAAMRAFVTYRVCDVGLLAALVVLHGAVGSGDIARTVEGAWPHGTCLLDHRTALVVGLLLAFAALGKSGQLPFSGWLPRAMEGPTPSSAIFYGALSIHAGAYLMLRYGAVLDAAPAAGWVLAGIGIATALHATLVGRTQTDLKSMLAYASMAQAGLILAEIGLGLRVIPLLHVIGHATLRSLQFLRAPSALRDRHELASALGGHHGHGSTEWPAWLPPRARHALYRASLDRGLSEAILMHGVVDPAIRFLRTIAAIELRWRAILEGSARNTRSEGRRHG
jgi:NADH-quinone oxidoreductase subunit L